MPPAIIAAAGLAVATVGTVASISQGTKAANATKKAQGYTRQQDALAAAQNKREAIRAARISYANAQQTGENQGVADSSSSQGGLASIASQLNGNLSFLDQYSSLGDMASLQLGKAAGHAAGAQTWGAVAGLGKQVFSNASGISKAFGG